MYFPEQRHISTLTVIRRECVLPDNAIGTVRTTEGKRVDMRDIVAHGVIPSRYMILDAAEFFGLRNLDKLDALLLVKPRDLVDVDDPLAGKNSERGKRLLSPVRGVVAGIDQGRIIVQEMPETVDLEAGIRGRIVSVRPGRGVRIEAIGAVVQCIWGNGRRLIAPLRLAPEEGISTIASDSLEMRFIGSVVVSRQTIHEADLDIAVERNFAALIAPSMDAALIDKALNSDLALILTEGFGTIRMNNTVYTILSKFEGQQATVDAHHPDRWNARRPDVILNIPVDRESRPERPNPMLVLRPGMQVRVTRAPYLGLSGRVLDLPKSPVILDNGLRVLCARVELTAGETVFVPLNNLEVLGH
jgi:hypothetical protein